MIVVRMGNIWLGLITFAVLAAVGFLISVLIELRKTAKSLIDFLRNQEDLLNTTLSELQQTLKSLRDVSNDVNEIMVDAKSFSNAVSNIGDNIKHASNLIENTRSLAFIKASGLRVGIKTAFTFLLKNLLSKKRGA
jgi:predicted PurR-regulated permease PerM